MEAGGKSRWGVIERILTWESALNSNPSVPWAWLAVQPRGSDLTSLMSYVTLGRFLNLSVPQLPLK